MHVCHVKRPTGRMATLPSNRVPIILPAEVVENADVGLAYSNIRQLVIVRPEIQVIWRSRGKFPSMFNHLFKELKRRKVFQVAGLYGVTAWLLTQIVVAVEKPLMLPDWFDTAIIVLLLIGFPIALIMAWAFDLTPQGVIRTTHDEEAPAPPRNRPALYAGLIFFALAGGWLLRGIEPVEDAVTASLSTRAAAAVDVSAPVPGFEGRPAIAVLPFMNMSNDQEQEYFSDGITEDITTALQSLALFPVIARTSTFTYKGLNKDIRDIARELGAGYVLEGSVRKIGDNVRITAQLIDAAGNHLWAEKFDRPISDLFTVQDEITHRIVASAEPEIMAKEIARTSRTPTRNMQAWDYYLRSLADTTVFLGYSDLNGKWVSLERNQRAQANVEKAIELDPDFAAAYTHLSHVYAEYNRTLRSDISDEFATEARKLALENAVRARGMNPFDATACSCHAMLLLMGGDQVGAQQLQEEALLVNPASATVHTVMAKILHAGGDGERALGEIKISQRLSPMDMTLSRDFFFEAEILAGLGRYEEAVAKAHSAVLHSPTNYDAHVIRILSLYVLGREDEARQALQALVHNVPDFAVEELWLTPLPRMLDPESPQDRLPMTKQGPWINQVTDILVELGWQG